jgi:uncharacterized protein (TIGR03034 family)
MASDDICAKCGAVAEQYKPFMGGQIALPKQAKLAGSMRPHYGLPKGGSFMLCSACRQGKPATAASSGFASQSRAASTSAAPAPPISAVAPLPLPARIFTTQHLMDDMSAPDMRYKDIPEDALRNFYGLNDVSARCNPFTLRDRQKSATILFDEFRALSDMASFYGPYQDLMRQMIDHMQGNSGATFRHPLLDRAMSERIDMTEETKTLANIQRVLSDNLDWASGAYPLHLKDRLRDAVLDSVLPKFNHWTDRVNGLGITMHDTWATHITLQSLTVTGNRFSAQVHFRIQDHFGLDDQDVLSPVYRQFRMFRIWFLLQHWVEYGYRPFITETNVTKTIEGSR